MLERARALGFLGPPPVSEHLAHAEGFRTAIAAPASARALDLGSGGGVPGLVLALAWPGTTWTLLDAGRRRCEFLEGAVAELGLGARVTVVEARAEVAGRSPAHRGRYDLVTARSFGPPPVTAECAAPFLALGGHVLVSEPPTPEPGRWPPAGVAVLGMEAHPRPETTPAVQLLTQVAPCPERYPRRVGVPAKRPLW